MSLEEWIHRTDPFRYSTLDSPFPLPVVENNIEPLARDSPDPEIKRFTRVRVDLVDIFTKCGIQTCPSFYTLRVRSVDKPGYDAPMHENPLLQMKTDANTSTKAFLVDINPAKTQYSTWKRAAEECRKYLVERGMQDYHVEIVDLTRAFQPSLFPLKPSHPDIKAWEGVRNGLATYLDNKLPSRWRNICLWNVKDSIKAENIVTVVVHVDVRLKADWLRLRLMLRGYLPAEKRWDILFLPGGVSRSATKLDNGRSFKGEINHMPRTGASIGPLGGGVATLGGYVRLQQGPRVHHCIMTTHSAVRRHEYEADEASRIDADRYGWTYFNLSDSPDWAKAWLQFPAKIDTEATKKDCRDALKMAQKELEEVKRELELVPGSLLTDAGITDGDRIEREVVTAQKQMVIADKLSMGLGRVLVSSGRHIGPKSKERRHMPLDHVHWELASDEAPYLDWALIELPKWDPKWSKERTRAPLHKELGHHAPINYAIFRSYGCWFPDQQASEFTAIEKNAWYCKRGRSTDVTAGLCHGTTLYTNRLQARHRHGGGNESKAVYDEKGKKIPPHKDRHYKESVIVNWKSEREQIPENFCAPGDEGAFVFDIEGQVAGMLVGALTSRCGPPPRGQKQGGWEGTRLEEELYVNAGIVTSMHHILPSVARHTVDDRVEGERESGGVLSLDWKTT
jgi:hypothetical protein